MRSEPEPPPRDPAQQAADNLLSELRGGTYDSLEELQAATDRLTRRRNQAPRDDFHGLSAEEMFHILHLPFESPHLFTFVSPVHGSPQAPILTMFGVLANALGDHGLKPTATGALPLAVVRQIQQFPDVRRFLDLPEDFSPHSERDVPLLHATRLIAQLAGLVRKYGGRMILGRECRKVLKQDGLGGIYPRLFVSLATEFNWSYLRVWEQPRIIQLSFVYTLYLLSRFGDVWRPSSFYEDAFLQAFPMVIEEIASTVPLPGPERLARIAYRVTALRNFAAFAGLAQMEYTNSEPYPVDFRVRKSPLLDQFVSFHFRPSPETRGRSAWPRRG